MSFCKSDGKDKIIFLTKEDTATPSNVKLPDDDEEPGAILPNGEINWNCPCLGGMVTGPCGVEFREAFSCFQYSTAAPKGSDCFEQFHRMQECTSHYPNLYPQGNSSSGGDEDDDEDFDEKSLLPPTESTVAPAEPPVSQLKTEADSKKQ